MIAALAEFFLPRLCVVCGAPGDFTCASCIKFLPLVGNNICVTCGRPFPGQAGTATPVKTMTHPCASCLTHPPAYDAHRAVLRFDEIAQKLVHALKYGAKFWVGRFYRQLIRERCREFAAAELIIPVPLSTARLRERGHNQSLALARQWRVLTGKPLSYDALIRVKNTTSQTGLSRAERRENLKGAFAIPRPELIRDKTILLVDDVHTTGATLSAAAAALKATGAKRVFAATLAVVPLDNAP